MCSQETHFSFKDTHKLKVKEWKSLRKGKPKEERGKLYILDKTD